MPNQPSDYKHIRAWGKKLLSFDYYIEDQQQQAVEDNAPLDACYKNGDTWVCASTMRQALQDELNEAIKRL